MKIYYFFNPVTLPPNLDDFKSYVRIDSGKLAAFFEESWRLHGWEPVLVRPTPNLGWKDRGNLDLEQEFASYWFQMLELAPAWFANVDVFNRRFLPRYATTLEMDTLKNGRHACSLARNFNMGCVWMTKEFCQQVLLKLSEAREGRVKVKACALTDESIIREHMCDLVHQPSFNSANPPIMSFGWAENDWHHGMLVHFCRNFFQWSPMAVKA